MQQCSIEKFHGYMRTFETFFKCGRFKRYSENYELGATHVVAPSAIHSTRHWAEELYYCCKRNNYYPEHLSVICNNKKYGSLLFSCILFMAV